MVSLISMHMLEISKVLSRERFKHNGQIYNSM